MNSRQIVTDSPKIGETAPHSQKEAPAVGTSIDNPILNSPYLQPDRYYEIGN